MSRNLRWAPGKQPWIRRKSHLGSCYFCGDDQLVISSGDLERDTGRVEVYCDNPDCAAREITVLIARDGSGAGNRADVRALDDVDCLSTRGATYVDVEALLAVSDEEIAARRSGKPAPSAQLTPEEVGLVIEAIRALVYVIAPDVPAPLEELSPGVAPGSLLERIVTLVGRLEGTR